MKIVFNTTSLQNSHPQDKYFLHESLKRLIIKYAEHEFIVIIGRHDGVPFLVGKNVTTVITRQPLPPIVLRKLWFDFKLPAILKKYKADVFVSADVFCSLTTALPQCLLLHDRAFFYEPKALKRSTRFFYKRYLPKFFNKAKTIAVVSPSFKKDLSLRYQIDDDKIDVLYPAPKADFLPLVEAMKKEIKDKYCQGKSYFIAAQRVHSQKSLMNLLKAFSIFKRRQKSNWKLVVTGSMESHSKLFTESLKTYKYRDDIVLTGMVNETDLVKLTGASYALILLSQWNGVSVLEAMNCHIPVIVPEEPFTKDIAGDAALYANTDDYNDIAEKMMLLYKDESLRDRLVEKGEAVIEQYNWDKTSDALWKSIQKAYAPAGKIQR